MAVLRQGVTMTAVTLILRGGNKFAHAPELRGKKPHKNFHL
jgi:hypothetical protein